MDEELEINNESDVTIVEDGEDLIEEVVDDHDSQAVIKTDDEDFNDKAKPEVDDDAEYGKKVQRRISKEVQKRKILEDRLAFQEIEHERRMSEFEERFNAREQQEEDSSLSEQLKDIEAKRRENHEVGDYDQELENEWFDIKSKQRETKKVVKNRKPAKKQSAPESEDAGTGAERAPIPAEQKKWLDSNKWYGKNKVRSDYANNEYLNLVSEGYDPEDSDIYAELDSRMSGDPQSQDGGDTDGSDRDERPPPPAKPNRGNNSNSQRKSNTFTNDDKARMREWNLDPNDANERKAWLAQKRRA